MEGLMMVVVAYMLCVYRYNCMRLHLYIHHLWQCPPMCTVGGIVCTLPSGNIHGNALNSISSLSCSMIYCVGVTKCE